PPLFVGGVKVTVAWLSAADAVPMVGAAGTVAGVARPQVLACELSATMRMVPSGSVDRCVMHGSGLAAPELSAQSATGTPSRRSTTLEASWPGGSADGSSKNVRRRGASALAGGAVIFSCVP